MASNTASRPLKETEVKELLAAKYKAVALDLQKFFDSAPPEAYESSHCEELSDTQTRMCDAYEELTGKTVF